MTNLFSVHGLPILNMCVLDAPEEGAASVSIFVWDSVPLEGGFEELGVSASLADIRFLTKSEDTEPCLTKLITFSERAFSNSASLDDKPYYTLKIKLLTH